MCYCNIGLIVFTECRATVRGFFLTVHAYECISSDLCSHIAAVQYLKRPTRKLERDFLQGRVVIGQRVMALNGKRGDLD